MLQKIKTTLAALGAVFLISAPALLPATVSAAPDEGGGAENSGSADIKNSVCSGANDLKITETPGTTCENIADTEGQDKVNSLITQVINVISVIVGVVAVIMIIFGGFRYVTSGGSSEKVGSAKNTILYALIGLIIVALSQVIVRFVLTKTAGT